MAVPALGIVGAALTELFRRRSARSTTGGNERPSTERQVEFARELVAEIKSDRDELNRELAQVLAHVRALEDRDRHQAWRIWQLERQIERMMGMPQ